MFYRHAAQLLFAAQAAQAAFSWGGSEKMRGVNLGGWLVLEPWITPSIFQAHPGTTIVDEYTLCQQLGHDAAYNILKPHWDTWITENDIAQIAAWGFNMVRIPIGFWAYDSFGTPYVSGADAYLERAVGWARNHGIKVLVDLHGAPLSQNGFDNSGQKMPTPQWGHGDSVTQTLTVIQQIAKKYAAASYNDVILGVELLNEPFSFELDINQLRQFYRDGYGHVRQTNQQTVVVLQDAFKAPSYWNGFLTPQDANAQLVALDHHEYQVFDNNMVGWQPWQHRQGVCNMAKAYGGADKWSFVGEWTAAMTDCATYLNGYGVGARYDGSYPGSWHHGSCASINHIENWTGQMISDARGYIEAQMEAFEHETNGWTFWTLKTEASAEWDLYKLISVGAFPQPLYARNFSQICSTYN